MQLLDMGMSPMLSRQAAQLCGDNADVLEFKRLLRSLELIVLALSLIVFLTVSSANSWITNSWLNISSLNLDNVSLCIVLMSAMLCLRFFVTLYRSGIQGVQAQVWLNVSDIALVSIKFFGTLLLLKFVTQDFVLFFIYQLVVGVVELIVMATMFYRLIPSMDKVGIRFFWKTLKPMLPFACGIAYATVIWGLITQLDKMILSNILPLSEYGYFALVAVVSAGITQISGPISYAILPRMTALLSQGEEQEMLVLYRKASQIMTVVILPLTGVVALFSTELLFAWTGDEQAAAWGGPILFWFALGNGLLAISAFQYYLQFAHGKLRMHVIYNSISASIQIPLMIYLAFEYGALGVSIVWFVFRLITFIVWIPIVHNKFAPGIHWPWLFKDVAPTFMLTAVLLMLFVLLNIGFDSMCQLEIIAVLIGIWLMIFIVNLLFSNESRKLVLSMIPIKLNAKA